MARRRDFISAPPASDQAGNSPSPEAKCSTSEPIIDADGRTEQLLLELAKAIARRLAREEYDRMCAAEAGASAVVSEDKPAMK
jgi:hypothetical protein